MNSLERSSPEYINSALATFIRGGGERSLYGVSADRSPENFQELKDIVAEQCSKGVSDYVGVIYGFLDIIASFPDPDQITKELPFIEEHGAVLFVLPEI